MFSVETVQYSVQNKIGMFGWVYLYNFLRGADKLISKWKPRCSPFRITHQFWIWPMASYLKDPPCALRTPSTCRCSQWKQYNTVWRKKEIWIFGWVYLYNFLREADKLIFKWKPRFSPFRITHHILNVGNGFNTLRTVRVHLALLQLADVLSGNSTIQCAG